MREFIFWLGRVLFSAVFIGSGIGHLTQTKGSAEYATYKKVPNATLMVQISGICMLLGGLAVILGVAMDLAGLCLAILLVIMAVKMHAFWGETDPQAKQTEMAGFMKNISMAGAGLMLAAWGTYAPWTLTDGLFK